jgi:uncharacterized protein
VPQAEVVIDADVHCAPGSIEDLHPYLDQYWRDYIASAGVRLPVLDVAYPPGAPTTGSAPPSTYDALRDQLLEPSGARHAILNCVSAFEAHRHPYYAAALASAINDWLRAEWLERDQRLLASLVVSSVDPADAVAEIERVGDHDQFVQVLLPVRAEAPYGNKRYHALYAAAAEHDLAIGLHAWGRPVSAPTPTAMTHSYMEDYLSNQIIVQSHVLSLISEGVFERQPTLRVSLMECGFAWLPSLLWRFDKDWKGLWLEVPWVKDKPSSYLRRHFRATTAPAHLPADRDEARELLEMIGTDVLMYASDYPHRHGPSIELLDEVVDDEARRGIRWGNAAELYGLAA